ncbi:MAG: MFS transporter [Flavonifractor sp.]|nr:MFS transporter [Flavonifractor sp.]MCI9423974.1 MFS transporter [Flavonifractor sp.]
MIPHWKQKFAVLWVGQALSILTSMLSQYALIWYLTDLTGSSTVLSLATMAALLPQGILSLFTGAFADRFDRRTIMIAADGAIGAISLVLALMAWRAPLTPGPILLVAALRSVGGAFHAPCLQAVTPLIAPPEALTRCAGWSQGIQTVSMLLSPALAAALYAAVPLHWIILLDTLGAVFAICGLLLARLPALKVGDAGQKLRLWQDTREGFAVLRSHRWLWQLCLICALFSVAFMPVSALFPLMSMQYFGREAAAAALVETAFSVGMLAGSVLLGLWGGGKDKILTMTAAVLAMGGALAVTGVLPPSGFWWFAGLSLLMGVTCPFFNSVFMALIQEKVEAQYLGRVLGLSGAMMTLASPIGLGATALLAEHTGLTLWFLLAGVVTLLCGGLMLLFPAVRTCGR